MNFLSGCEMFQIGLKDRREVVFFTFLLSFNVLFLKFQQAAAEARGAFPQFQQRLVQIVLLEIDPERNDRAIRGRPA